MAKRILITGGTGFLGREVVALLDAAGYQCIVLSRKPRGKQFTLPGNTRVLGYEEPWPPVYGVINLAGESIVGIWTAEGWLYLAALLDTYSRFIVGWSMSVYRDEALVTAALRMALRRRDMPNTLVHHTDRGSQYTADDYLALLTACDIQVSMSGKGDPYDNAMIESFFSTLRAELTDLHRFQTRRQARTALFDFIEVFYNRQRLHSSLDYCSPLAYETNYFSGGLS